MYLHRSKVIFFRIFSFTGKLLSGVVFMLVKKTSAIITPPQKNLQKPPRNPIFFRGWDERRF